MKILVFPCGSEIALEIHKSLRYVKDIELFGASSLSDHGEYVFKNYIGGMPNVSDTTFILEINKIIEKYKIDFVFPAHDSVNLKFSENKDILKCPYVGSSFETTDLCRSKLRTYYFFEKIIRTPKVYSGENIQFPLFLKPDVGQGSKGCYIANNFEEYNFYVSKDKSLIPLEYLPGEEYTIDCFTDRLGNLKHCLPRSRARVSNGISSKSYNIDKDYSDFLDIAQKINSSLSFSGVWFFQLKRDYQGELALLEISPRVAGTMGLSRNKGVNLPLLSILSFNSFPLNILQNSYDIEVDRCFKNSFKLEIKYDNIYIDFDDTIINKNKVNTLVIKFLYQSLNDGKKIYLITKHSQDILITLHNFKISSNIFHKIIHLDKKENKYKYIEKNYSIFIDDSFSERKEVFDNINIPVFDVDSVESLIND